MISKYKLLFKIIRMLLTMDKNNIRVVAIWSKHVTHNTGHTKVIELFELLQQYGEDKHFNA